MQRNEHDAASVRRIARKVVRVRGQWFGRGQFAVLVTHWFYFSNHAYRGERRFFVRVGEWRKNFGGTRG